MIGRLFDRKPGYEAQVLAEAQAFIDDGLDVDFVLGLFPEDAEWLEGLLNTSTAITEAFESEPASYYFEASLKAQFLEGARRAEPVPVLLAAPPYSPARTAVASMSVLASAAAIGIVAVGFITSANAVPGDWNYAFKQANERFEYTLSRGDSRVDVQLRQFEERVHELQTLSSRGNVSVEALKNLQREIKQVSDLAQDKPLDPVQKARAIALTDSTKTVLTQVRESKPELNEETAAAAAAADDLVTVALGPEPTPTATATTEPTAAADPTATEEPATETPESEETVTPEPSETESPGTGQTASP
jgi:hypothetical protein